MLAGPTEPVELVVAVRGRSAGVLAACAAATGGLGRGEGAQSLQAVLFGPAGE